MSRQLSPPATIGVGIATGLFASWVKVKVEAPMQVQAEKWWPPKPGQLDMVGADPARQPEKMPPAVLAAAAWKRWRGTELTTEQRLKAQAVIHYVFGAGYGAVYALVAGPAPVFTRLLGGPAGAALYAGTHGTTLPLAGVQPWATELPRAAVAWEGGSHVVFGIANELSRRFLVAVLSH
jgi:putative membrane protein